MRKTSSYTVVMTACIAPTPNHNALVRVDPRVRMSDYVEAARRWLELDDPNCREVVFLENSGYPLDEIIELRSLASAKRPITIVRVSNNDIPDGISYGFAELGMLDEASDTLPQWRDAEKIVKVTGRLWFPEVPRLLSSLSESVVFCGDARNRRMPFNRDSENGVMTTQIMVFTPEFYRRHMYNLRAKMRPVKGHRLIESLYYRELFDLHRRPSVLFRFPVDCVPVGQAAHWQKQYQVGMDAFQQRFRRAVRRVLPWWWV